MTNLYTISSSGWKIKKTNYWDSDAAKDGQFFMSWNAAQLRLLVPDSQLLAILEMKKCLCIDVTYFYGDDFHPHYEILFDDGSSYPLAIALGAGQSDRNFIPYGDAIKLRTSIWYRGGVVFARKGVIDKKTGNSLLVQERVGAL